MTTTTIKGNELRRRAKELGIKVPRTATKADLAAMIQRHEARQDRTIPYDVVKALRVCHRDCPNAARTVRAYIDELLNADG